MTEVNHQAIAVASRFFSKPATDLARINEFRARIDLVGHRKRVGPVSRTGLHCSTSGRSITGSNMIVELQVNLSPIKN
jgi:hypothetical protein